DILQQEEKRAEPIVVPPPSKLTAALNELMTEVESVSGVKFETEDLRRRFRVVVETFFKDLRDELETRSKLTMSIVSGGLGLTDEQTGRLMDLLKSRRKEFEAKIKDQTLKDRTEFVSQAAEKQLTGRDLAEKKEQEDLDRRFAKLTDTESEAGADIKARQSPPPASPPRVIKVVGATKSQQKTSSVNESAEVDPAKVRSDKLNELNNALENLGEQKINQSDQVTPNNVRPEEEGPKDKLGSTVDQLAVKPAMLSEKFKVKARPPKNLPIVDQPIDNFKIETQPTVTTPVQPPIAPAVPSSRPTAPPSTPLRPAAVLPPPSSPPETGKPLVSDVKISPKRLIGPVEELRSITLKDFRRLSKDPKEATLKLKDKVDLLGEDQSFEIKTAGIKAWRSSPINKLYLDILRQSLEGKPISDVMADFESRGEDVLTKAEFDAIMKFNRELRFG
ncbi:hypothetical protein KKE28_05240, partial [Patescibacteria group bacterium]|nr:hypothetical protein [Patescibacteria group bacterium]